MIKPVTLAHISGIAMRYRSRMPMAAGDALIVERSQEKLLLLEAFCRN